RSAGSFTASGPQFAERADGAGTPGASRRAGRAYEQENRRSDRRVGRCGQGVATAIVFQGGRSNPEPACKDRTRRFSGKREDPGKTGPLRTMRATYPRAGKNTDNIASPANEGRY